MRDFWTLIEQSADHPDRAEWIQRRLALQPPPQIVEFDIAYSSARRKAETWTMWAAGYRIMSGLCSSDGFWYFLPWVVGLGRDRFDAVVANPDALADVPQVRRLAALTMDQWADADWPEWESLNYGCRMARLSSGPLLRTEGGRLPRRPRPSAPRRSRP